jgi:ubiquinone/menaquinone biosynthesis C-methylase UbiE
MSGLSRTDTRRELSRPKANHADSEVQGMQKNAMSSGEVETLRIRSAYARRNYTVPKDRYSLFKEENLLAHQEVQRELIRLLRHFERTDLERAKILDVGCGAGFWLRQLIQWGARPGNLFGIDLLEERITEGKKLCPSALTLKCQDASRLDFEDCTFDLVLQFTVFTSVLDSMMKSDLAKEMKRVLRPGGCIVWYDYFVSNPRNPDVRGVNRKEIKQLFSGLSVHLRRITLAPPLGRAVGSRSPTLYRLLSICKPLCTHYLGFFQKP